MSFFEAPLVALHSAWHQCWMKLPLTTKFEDHDHCPKCGSSMIGEPIPIQDRRQFDRETHFKRWIGIEDARTDRLSSIQCPDCGVKFPAY